MEMIAKISQSAQKQKRTNNENINLFIRKSKQIKLYAQLCHHFELRKQYTLLALYLLLWKQYLN